MDPQHLALLRIHDACRGLSDADIEALTSAVDVVHLAAGECVHRASDENAGLFIVISGRLKMMVMTPDGGRRILRYISAGDQFGALTLVSEEPIPVDVLVDEKAVLFHVKQDDAGELIERIPKLRRNLLRKIGFGVQDAMHWRRKRIISKVVAFIETDEQAMRLVGAIASQLARGGERIGVLSDVDVRSMYAPGTEFKLLRNETGEFVDDAELHATLDQWLDLTRIFIVVGSSFPTERLNRLVKFSDAVFCLVKADQYQPALKSLSGLIGQTPSWRKKTHLIWRLLQDQQVAPYVPELSKLSQLDFKVPARTSDARLFKQGIDRIVHYLRGLSIGLALSGGAAHGMAHLGVLRALEEAGITVDKVAGTSAGVLTGVLYCAGYSTDWGVKSFTHDLEPGLLYKILPRGDSLYMLESYRSGAWERMLRKYLQRWRLEQLPIPVSTVTTDLISAQSVARSAGDAVDSILESINLPVLALPICRDGMLLVDGGIVNNLPADLLVNQGCNMVIGVDVAAHIESRVGENYPDTPTSEMKTPGVVSTLLRCLHVQAHNMSRVGAEPADVIIAPDVSMFDPTAFTRTPEMADVGYEATQEALPRIQEILSRLDEDI